MAKQRVLADTSIQIGKFKYKEIKNHIKKLSEQEKEEVITSFYVLFEFKVGLILNLIDFWNHINIASDIPQAINKWSEGFSSRQPKNFMLLQALILEKFGSIPNDRKKFLRKIEATIFHLLENFFSGIKNVPIGDFRNDEIVRFEINSSKDYPAFVNLCRTKNEMTDQIPFWTKYKNQLDALVADQNVKTNCSAIHEALSRINNDIKYANMLRTNKAIGDAVIATDARLGVRILTTDKSFESLGPALGKEVERIPNQY